MKYFATVFNPAWHVSSVEVVVESGIREKGGLVSSPTTKGNISYTHCVIVKEDQGP